jgi:hypothetical protein
MFRVAYRSSLGALTVFCSFWFTYACGDAPWSSMSEPHSDLTIYVNQRLQIQLELLMMSGMPLETC